MVATAPATKNGATEEDPSFHEDGLEQSNPREKPRYENPHVKSEHPDFAGKIRWKIRRQKKSRRKKAARRRASVLHLPVKDNDHSARQGTEYRMIPAHKGGGGVKDELFFM